MREQYSGLFPDPVALAGHAARVPLRHVLPLLHRVPYLVQAQLLESTLNRVFAEALGEGRLDFLAGRCIALIVEDIHLRWPFSLRDRRIIVLRRDTPHDAAIRAKARNFLTLAARHDDADAFFFRRELHMDGNVELAMALRSLLDELPVGSAAPPALRFARELAERLTGIWPEELSGATSTRP